VPASQREAVERWLKDVAVTAVLSASALRQVWRQTWPDEEDKSFRGYYAGYHRARGEDRQTPAHEDAALLLFSGPMPKTTRLVAPHAGYNLGLAGLSAPMVLKLAKRSLCRSCSWPWTAAWPRRESGTNPGYTEGRLDEELRVRPVQLGKVFSGAARMASSSVALARRPAS